MKLTPTSRLWSRDVRYRSLELRGIMHVNNFPPYLLLSSVEGRKALHRLSTSLECCLILNGQCVLVHLCAIKARSALFYIICLFSALLSLFLM